MESSRAALTTCQALMGAGATAFSVPRAQAPPAPPDTRRSFEVASVGPPEYDRDHRPGSPLGPAPIRSLPGGRFEVIGPCAISSPICTHSSSTRSSKAARGSLTIASTSSPRRRTPRGAGRPSAHAARPSPFLS
jgi:hypothetical protein